jgi:hypothetical protein
MYRRWTIVAQPLLAVLFGFLCVLCVSEVSAFSFLTSFSVFLSVSSVLDLLTFSSG